MKIIPTIFALDKKNFVERFNKLIKISDSFQIDLMDGIFVAQKSVSLKNIPNLKKLRKEFEAHLMVKYPGRYIKKLKEKGFKKIIFHIEPLNNCERVSILIKKIKNENLKVFLALNPETPLEKIYPFLKSIDGVFLMGVHPGKEGQKFISNVYKKIKKLKQKNNHISIEIDGGVNLKNIKRLKKLGVDMIAVGSFISNADNPKSVFEKLKN